MKNMVNLTE